MANCRACGKPAIGTIPDVVFPYSQHDGQPRRDAVCERHGEENRNLIRFNPPKE